jgi:tetraacyldisaccharide 4'-kinase
LLSLTHWLQRQWWQPTPSWAARLLQPLAAIYSLLARRDQRRTTPQAVGKPVVVVGNWVVGGAGKTPTTIALVRALQARGMVVGVVSRGHGRSRDDVMQVKVTVSKTPAFDTSLGPWTPPMTAQDVGDEPLLIALKTGVPVFVGRDRVAAAQALLKAHPGVDVLVADDGLQHHRLARDAQVIVVDERGLGNGLHLPAGPLREKPLAMPARSCLLYNAAKPSTSWPGHMAQRSLPGLLRLDAWWRGERATPLALHALRDKPVAAAAGIASPERFFAMLEAMGLSFVRWPLPDHFDWRRPPPLGQDQQLVITEKDAVKLHRWLAADPASGHAMAQRVWVAPLDFRIPEALVDEMQALLPAATRALAPSPQPHG